MEEIMMKIAQESAIAAVAIIAIWRLSVVNVVLAKALTEVAIANSKTVSEVAHPD